MDKEEDSDAASDVALKSSSPRWGEFENTPQRCLRAAPTQASKCDAFSLPLIAYCALGFYAQGLNGVTCQERAPRSTFISNNPRGLTVRIQRYTLCSATCRNAAWNRDTNFSHVDCNDATPFSCRSHLLLLLVDLIEDAGEEGDHRREYDYS